MNLFDKNNRFNIANLVTYLNVALGVTAIYFIVQDTFFIAIILSEGNRPYLHADIRISPGASCTCLFKRYRLSCL